VPPTGGCVLYRANAEVDTRADLYCAGLDGVRRISSPFIGSPKSVVTYRVSDDGRGAVFGEGSGFGRDDSPAALFGGPTDGSHAPVLLGPGAGMLQSYALDPSGARVVYLQLDTSQHLYSVPALGGLHVLLSGLARAISYALTPDRTRVVFTGTSGTTASM